LPSPVVTEKLQEDQLGFSRTDNPLLHLRPVSGVIDIDGSRVVRPELHPYPLVAEDCQRRQPV
jgi:hypothetical protein